MTSADAGDSDHGTPALPPVPPSATALFGDRLDLAIAYAARLAGDGVNHGHIGPRELPRLWERHLLNSALVTDVIPADEPATVVDVGSGAGLPGVPMAIRRPDLHLVLLEPMARRIRFLEDVVSELDLASTVSVVRGRADDAAIRKNLVPAEWVVARAVAPMDRLVGWCLPLLRPGGTLLALKGRTAADEVERDEAAIRRVGGSVRWVKQVAVDADAEPTWIVAVRRETAAPPTQRPRRTRSSR